jgi:hypothetical protein
MIPTTVPTICSVVRPEDDDDGGMLEGLGIDGDEPWLAADKSKRIRSW